MTLREYLKLSALCVAAAITSGAVVTMLLPAAHIENGTEPSHIIRSIPVQTSAIPAPRLKPGYAGHARTRRGTVARPLRLRPGRCHR